MEDNMLLVSWLDGSRILQNENDVSSQQFLIRCSTLGESPVLYEWDTAWKEVYSLPLLEGAQETFPWEARRVQLSQG